MSAQNKLPTIRRWSGGQHPSYPTLVKLLEGEGLMPYRWTDSANRVYPVRVHGYGKVLMVLEGALDVAFPDLNRVYTLTPGDRADIPAGLHHSITVSARGVTCVEAAISKRPHTRRTQEIPPVTPYGR